MTAVSARVSTDRRLSTNELEGEEAAALAATRISPDEGRLVRETLDRARARLERGEDPSEATPPISFHTVVASLADNPMLSEMLHSVSKRTSWYRSAFELGRRRRTWEEHEAIGVAILAGDPDAARAAGIAHVEGARRHDKHRTEQRDG